jgi:1-acyl-sn-glycerol-3-phosphate acyltransferase
MNDVEQALRQERCLCVFPEGTTTDGNDLKPFKSSLFQAAINTGAEVWPVAIHYPKADGGTNTAVAYHGNTTLWQSLQAVLQQREITVELHLTPPLPAQGQERRHLSHHARQSISSSLHLRRHKAPEKSGGLPTASR